MTKQKSVSRKKVSQYKDRRQQSTWETANKVKQKERKNQSKVKQHGRSESQKLGEWNCKEKNVQKKGTKVEKQLDSSC